MSFKAATLQVINVYKADIIIVPVIPVAKKSVNLKFDFKTRHAKLIITKHEIIKHAI